MRFVFHTICASPHQLPLAREMVRLLGQEEYRYIYSDAQTEERTRLGWTESNAEWMTWEGDSPDRCLNMMQDCELLMSGIREFNLFEWRIKRNLKTIYCSERWFKPISIPFTRAILMLPGWLRLLAPKYFRFAKRIAALIGGDGPFYCFPMGVWAERDMLLVCRLFGVPKGKASSKIRLWGYYVDGGAGARIWDRGDCLKLLWVGRFIDWKRVDTIITAVRKILSSRLKKISLDIYGAGAEENRLKKMASRFEEAIRFHPPVAIAEVRSLMRSHDVYVLSSNGEEGWGAVLNEAIEEGMKVIGTYEAGSSATILPESNLYHAGDWRALRRLLEGNIATVGIGKWTPDNAAKQLMEVLNAG